MAAGWPCAAIAGRRDLFADVAASAVTHAGTCNGDTIATAAVLASIDELASGEVHEQVEKTGTALMELIRARAAASQLNLHLQGVAMGFHASFAAPSEPITRYRQLQDADAGRYGAPRGHLHRPGGLGRPPRNLVRVRRRPHGSRHQ